MGDFNAISKIEEKYSRSPSNLRQIDMFNVFIQECKLVDLGFHREAFTWSNKRVGKKHVQERLDIGLASIEWRLQFPFAQIHHGELIGSNHWPIWLDSTLPR